MANSAQTNSATTTQRSTNGNSSPFSSPFPTEQKSTYALSISTKLQKNILDRVEGVSSSIKTLEKRTSKKISEVASNQIGMSNLIKKFLSKQNDSSFQNGQFYKKLLVLKEKEQKQAIDDEKERIKAERSLKAESDKGVLHSLFKPFTVKYNEILSKIEDLDANSGEGGNLSFLQKLAWRTGSFIFTGTTVEDRENSRFKKSEQEKKEEERLDKEIEKIARKNLHLQEINNEITSNEQANLNAYRISQNSINALNNLDINKILRSDLQSIFFNESNRQKSEIKSINALANILVEIKNTKKLLSNFTNSKTNPLNPSRMFGIDDLQSGFIKSLMLFFSYSNFAPLFRKIFENLSSLLSKFPIEQFITRILNNSELEGKINFAFNTVQDKIKSEISRIQQEISNNEKEIVSLQKNKNRINELKNKVEKDISEDELKELKILSEKDNKESFDKAIARLNKENENLNDYQNNIIKNLKDVENNFKNYENIVKEFKETEQAYIKIEDKNSESAKALQNKMNDISERYQNFQKVFSENIKTLDKFKINKIQELSKNNNNNQYEKTFGNIIKLAKTLENYLKQSNLDERIIRNNNPENNETVNNISKSNKVNVSNIENQLQVLIKTLDKFRIKVSAFIDKGKSSSLIDDFISPILSSDTSKGTGILGSILKFIPRFLTGGLMTKILLPLAGVAALSVGAGMLFTNLYTKSGTNEIKEGVKVESDSTDTNDNEITQNALNGITKQNSDSANTNDNEITQNALNGVAKQNLAKNVTPNNQQKVNSVVPIPTGREINSEDACKCSKNFVQPTINNVQTNNTTNTETGKQSSRTSPGSLTNSDANAEFYDYGRRACNTCW